PNSHRELPDRHPFPTRRSSDLLAVALMFQDSETKKAEARELIEQNLKTSSASIDDQIVKGVLLSNKKETLKEGIKLLEKAFNTRSEEHTSELQSRSDLVCRLLL